jgi:5-methylcytosine-specific restriction endonuclease McrA
MKNCWSIQNLNFNEKVVAKDDDAVLKVNGGRYKLWKKNFPNSINGDCYVCKNDINIENFHAGHIISIKNGGNDNIDNLKIICSLCNLSMGIQNLEKFKEKYF